MRRFIYKCNLPQNTNAHTYILYSIVQLNAYTAVRLDLNCCFLARAHATIEYIFSVHSIVSCLRFFFLLLLFSPAWRNATSRAHRNSLANGEYINGITCHRQSPMPVCLFFVALLCCFRVVLWSSYYYWMWRRFHWQMRIFKAKQRRRRQRKKRREREKN